MWDLFAFSLDMVGTGLWGKYLSFSDRQIGYALRSAFLSLAHNATIAAHGWKPLFTRNDNDEDDGGRGGRGGRDDGKNDQAHRPSLSDEQLLQLSYNINLVGKEGTVSASAGYRREECKLWASAEMEALTAIN
eukprot:CAMPEP_0170181322 /NCGR_PEP_ID=MMETSP0040_2-20121228/24819_1 /TAXON_ID=641309 /ORGANISM="Lotharella oceanica, Strain CCMP622" /LENGTH=132 /DNA_ID=CAMNT_0010426329 /DNA_START=59 /DNA_END=457 /DNA_ORIENTATION=-